jgi:hypothetical protein
MSKRTIAATATDSDDESVRAGPSAPKRPRRARSTSGSTPSVEQPQIRSNESNPEEPSDDGASDGQASLDLDVLEEQIRTHIDASRTANTGRPGVCPLVICISLAHQFFFFYLDRWPEGYNRVCRNV